MILAIAAHSQEFIEILLAERWSLAIVSRLERRPLRLVQRIETDPQSQFVNTYVHLDGGADYCFDSGRRL
jgi:hypothetical protein